VGDIETAKMCKSVDCQTTFDRRKVDKDLVKALLLLKDMSF